MTEEALALVITLVILIVLFLWIPTLDFCGERCQRFLRGRRESRERNRSRALDVE